MYRKPCQPPLLFIESFTPIMSQHKAVSLASGCRRSDGLADLIASVTYCQIRRFTICPYKLCARMAYIVTTAVYYKPLIWRCNFLRVSAMQECSLMLDWIRFLHPLSLFAHLILPWVFSKIRSRFVLSTIPHKSNLISSTSSVWQLLKSTGTLTSHWHRTWPSYILLVAFILESS